MKLKLKEIATALSQFFCQVIVDRNLINHTFEFKVTIDNVTLMTKSNGLKYPIYIGNSIEFELNGAALMLLVHKSTELEINEMNLTNLYNNVYEGLVKTKNFRKFVDGKTCLIYKLYYENNKFNISEFQNNAPKCITLIPFVRN